MRCWSHVCYRLWTIVDFQSQLSSPQVSLLTFSFTVRLKDPRSLKTISPISVILFVSGFIMYKFKFHIGYKHAFFTTIIKLFLLESDILDHKQYIEIYEVHRNWLSHHSMFVEVSCLWFFVGIYLSYAEHTTASVQNSFANDFSFSIILTMLKLCGSFFRWHHSATSGRDNELLFDHVYNNFDTYEV